MSTQTSEQINDGTGLIALDPWLAPYANQLRERHMLYLAARRRIEQTGGLLGQISRGHHYFGFNRGEFGGKQGVWYREWAPNALQLRLIGEFNSWDRYSEPLVRDHFGVWGLFLPDDRYKDRLVHGSRVKVHVVTDDSSMDRIPAYIRRTIQEEDKSFTGQFWMPPQEFQWTHQSPKFDRTCGLRIYEAHVGMAQEEGKVGTFNEFTQNVLPRIKSLGYNALQLMAIMEHPYYGSFGYHVSNFYAVS